ncbi:MAG: hypothetical protein QOI24_4602 [Acidobacteriota bacterium]|nr:hypothetical protein [Acidobacteriota bacterium]
MRRSLIIVAAFIVGGFLFLVPGYIRPDSVAVYSYLRSAVFDRDFAFFNEWASAGLLRDGATLVAEVTPVGALANHWWIGTAILSLPAYLAATPFAPADGFSGLFALTLGWTTVAFAALTMLIAARLVPRHRAIALTAVAIGTPFFWYTFRLPLGTHIAGALCIALILLALDRDDGLLVGLAAGLAIATRIQHVVLLPALLFACIGRPPRFRFRAIAGGALALLPQAIAWNAIYGSPLGPLTSGGALEGTTWSPFHNLAFGTVLFSSYHGLLTWSPVVALAIAGWLVALRDVDKRQLAIMLLLMFAGEWLANGAFDRYFWGGMGFGGRRFTDLAVPFAIGISWFADRFGARVAASLAAIGSLWSVLLMTAAANGSLQLARYVSPAGLLAAAFSPHPFALQSPIMSREILLQSLAALAIIGVVAAIVFAITRSRFAPAFAVAYMVVITIGVACIAARTRDRAHTSAQRLHIDVDVSRRYGPLVDQRGLLQDEIAWARANGDNARAERTEGEVREINRLLAAMGR